MDLNDIRLSPNDILKKQFKVKMKGYDQEEVDTYLDQIISDYEVFAKIIAGLNEKVNQLESQLNQNQAVSVGNEDDVKTYQPSHLQSYEPSSTSSEPVESETTNVAMIQRISTLERKVYNLEQRMNAQDRTYQAN
ncbi:DivIVA domain-containing protein [Lactobacillus sp. PV034]|uniref:DivIVA domain-containing protein n=1 Tax=Lactobacillus sp. PV034 TaxID=2594495 RepID=UPI002240A700|nr:DivIVA domain-containing protein [Lactobacillus sp. PV034]QNQ80414.1 DivIVA domain-containing protein [Lactobacillus sp. PV034]